MDQVSPATSNADLTAVRRLFEEYSASLAIDLKLQHIDTELASLPGAYSAPRGALFLARAEGSAVGCIGLRSFSETVGEIKRLYVVPAFRGRGLARALMAAAIAAGRSIGYESLVLDSLASMHPAIALYQSFGFQYTEPYWANPYPDVVYFQLLLKA